MELQASLRESIASICGVTQSEVIPTATLEELGIDSLAAAEIITGVEVPMDVLRGLNGLRTVGEVADRLQREIDRPPAAGLA